MKPAAFEYFAPATVDEALARWASTTAGNLQFKV
jgi:hypothetical protein